MNEKTMSRFLAMLILALLAAAASPSTATALYWPEDLDAIALVEVRSIEHGLLQSDVRRVEYGAPSPVVPYKTYLSVRRVYPSVQLHRLQLEGITISSWMPDEGDRGVIALRANNGEYEPAGVFPSDGYLPRTIINGEERIEFPPASGNHAPETVVWEYLCDRIDLGRDANATEINAKWEARLTADTPETRLLALAYLLQVRHFTPDWQAFLETEHDERHLEKTVAVLSQLVPEHQAAGAFKALATRINTLSRPEDAAMLSQNMLHMALRHPDQKRVNALNRLFLLEYGPVENRQRLIHTFAQLDPWLDELKREERERLLEQMLTEPWRFPFISGYDDIEKLWKALAAREHPALQSYLRDFIKRPLPEFLRTPVNPQEIQQLIDLAHQLQSTDAP